jgi:hypothetical protein
MSSERTKKAQEACQILGRVLATRMPDHTCFALVVFATPDEGHDEGLVTCVSNSEGAPLAHALRVCLAQVMASDMNNNGGSYA